MARLNEPPMSMDNLETIKRKFLRQNRELARVNSAQSTRIRIADNECARLLSENLELRSKILRLEKEAEDNSARRIADHALEIKEKLEAQLLEWGSMLSTLGLEPPRKRRSLEGRKTITPRTSFNRSPRNALVREMRRNTEAAQEGRLPAIAEYSRQTLKYMMPMMPYIAGQPLIGPCSSEEILALYAETEDTTNSPDLGPPPVSRFVDNDPVKVDSPSKITGEAKVVRTMEGLPDMTPPRRLAPPSPVSPEHVDDAPEKKDVMVKGVKPLQLVPDVPCARAGSKRKFGAQESSTSAGNKATNVENEEPTKSVATKPPVRVLKTRRNMATTKPPQQLPSKENTPAQPAPSANRLPLSAKSTNQDLSSPKKADNKPSAVDRIHAMKRDHGNHGKGPAAKPKPQEARKPASLEPPKPTPITIPVESIPQPPVVDHVLLSPPLPDTPERGPRSNARDTPLPADISSQGDAARPSRRSRASVSYAEPNLRDKMRRPTKELFDAVAGERKFAQRQTKEDDDSHAASKADFETHAGVQKTPGLDKDRQQAKAERGNAAADRPRSPKSCSADKPTAAVATDSRKRPYAAGAKDGSAADMVSAKPDVETPHNQLGAGTERAVHDKDPYEFIASSPSFEAGAHDEKADKVRSSRGPRRASASTASGPSAARSRKRASMVAPKKSSMLDDDDYLDESYENSSGIGDSQAEEYGLARERVSRRRSMML